MEKRSPPRFQPEGFPSSGAGDGAPSGRFSHGGNAGGDPESDEPVTEAAINDNIAVVTTPNRKLIFRSQVTAWAEVR